MMLTTAPMTGYAVPAVPHWTVGVRSPVRSGQKPHSISQRLFCALVPELRVAGREGPQGPLVLHQSSNSRSVAHPFRSGLAVNNRNWSITMSSNTPAIRPHVEIVNGQLVTNSFKIAEHFGKIHRDVVRAIDGLDCSPEFRVRNFAQSSAPVPMPRGGVRHIKAYSITRDGFTFLAMGFTGAKAVQWKEAYIDAFNRMEAALNQPTDPLPIGAFVTMHAATQSLAGQRYLVTFNDDGTGYSAKAIPNDACVMTVREFIKALGDPNGYFFDAQMLIDLIDVVSARVRTRLVYSDWKCKGVK